MRVAAKFVWMGAVLVVASTNARAESEAALWMEAGASRELGDRFEASFEQHLRLDRDVSRVSAVMPELGLQYRLLEALQLETGYRFEYERDGDGVFVTRHRLHLDTDAEVEMGPVALGYRLRLQEQIREGGDELRHKFRNRAGAELARLDPWTPALEAELFHVVGNGDGVFLDKLRVTAGTEYDFGDQEVEVYYRVDFPQEDPDDPVRHIAGIQLGWKL